MRTMAAPSTRYAVAPDGVHIAYRVMGSGGPDVVMFGDWLVNSEAFWEEPSWSRFAERMNRVARWVSIDPRGSGGSDRVALQGQLTYEQAVADVHTVLDALGSERAFVVTHAQATPVAALFGAMHPERTAGLVLVSPFASLLDRGDGVGFPLAQRDAIVDLVTAGMGDPDSVWARLAIPGDDAQAQAEREVVARQQRLGASPSTWRAIMEMTVDYDIRDVLRAVSVPTLVMYREHDAIVAPALSRHVAELVPGALTHVVPGRGHFFAGDDDEGWLDAMESFITGSLPTVHVDRVLVTLLFTDIVGSTDRASTIGDAAWRQRLARHDEVCRSEVERHGGRLVKSTGDGMLATFDGPARAIRCALAVQAAAARLGLPVRAGLHTGEVELTGSDVAGIAVHIAARVCAMAGEAEVLVSGAVPPLVVGSGIEFSDRGEHVLRGVPGMWRVLAVTP